MSAAADSVLRDVVGHLDARTVGSALIGAHAIALHGAPRATIDTDLLVADPVCLDAAFWAPLASAGHDVDVRVGDPEDPLRGVVRIGPQDAHEVDVVVPRGAWVADIITRAIPTSLRGTRVRVATAADLILLKLYAGGPGDLRDIRSILDTPAGPDARIDVEQRIGGLPRAVRTAWKRLRAE